MPLQHFLIDAGAAVIALEEAYRGKLDQVLIADPVLREQDEMRIRGAERRVSGGAFPPNAGARRRGRPPSPNPGALSRRCSCTKPRPAPQTGGTAEILP